MGIKLLEQANSYAVQVDLELHRGCGEYVKSCWFVLTQPFGGSETIDEEGHAASILGTPTNVCRLERTVLLR